MGARQGLARHDPTDKSPALQQAGVPNKSDERSVLAAGGRERGCNKATGFTSLYYGITFALPI